MKKICEICSKEFEAKTTSKFCSKECKSENTRRQQREKHREKLNKKFEDKVEGEEFVVCKICGLKSRTLDTHIQRTHKITVGDYYNKFNCDKFSVYCSDYLCENSERIKGENNPAYKHDGKYSPFSEKFINGTDKIEETKEKAKQSRINNNSNNTTIEFYNAKGLTIEEAQDKLRERQSTFSKNKCIEKYGEVEGLKVWNERQDKWQSTLNSKSDEELGEINMRKASAHSKIANEFFSFLDKIVKYKCEYGGKYGEINVGKYLPDFCIPELKFIIEFNGDFWHCNPELYNEYFYHPIVKKTANEIWEHDDKKIEYFINRGYNTYIVWEQEYINNKKETINKYVRLIEEIHNSVNILKQEDRSDICKNI